MIGGVRTERWQRGAGSEEAKFVVRCDVIDWERSLVGPQAGSMVRGNLPASAAVSTRIWSRSWDFFQQGEVERMRGLAAMGLCWGGFLLAPQNQRNGRSQSRSWSLALVLTCFFSCSSMTTKGPSQAEEGLPRTLNPGGDGGVPYGVVWGGAGRRGSLPTLLGSLSHSLVLLWNCGLLWWASVYLGMEHKQ